MPDTLTQLERDCIAVFTGAGYRRFAHVVVRPTCWDFVFQSSRQMLAFVRCAYDDAESDLRDLAEMSSEVMFLDIILLRPTAVTWELAHGRTQVFSIHGDWPAEVRRLLH